MQMADEVQLIPLTQVDIYGGTQTRVSTNEDAVASYAEEMAAGSVFPPITLYYDGAKYWLADGFHRFLAAQRLEFTEIEAEVKAGARGDALKFALGANATNGLYRSHADKRNAVEIALRNGLSCQIRSCLNCVKFRTNWCVAVAIQWKTQRISPEGGLGRMGSVTA